MRNANAWGKAAVRTVGLIAASLSVPSGASAKEESKMPFTISSPAFTHEGEIPMKYTCEDQNVSPALAWTEPPPGTKSLALIVDDPDAPDPAAPKMTWVHWVLYNLPPEVPGLTEAVAEKDLPKGTLRGTSDYKRTAWGGPCPPIGRHRYFFKLYALDRSLPDLTLPNKAALLEAMDGHVLAQAELMGTYEKKKSR